MTLTEYLASPAAVEDVRALLASTDRNDDDAIAYQPASGRIYWGRNEAENIGGAWNLAFVIFYTEADKPNESARCYYREPTPGTFIVSDCGEAVSGIMRRLGKHGSEARRLLTWVLLNEIDEDEEAHNAELSSTIHVECAAADLPSALVSVLSAVAKCAEVK